LGIFRRPFCIRLKLKISISSHKKSSNAQKIQVRVRRVCCCFKKLLVNLSLLPNIIITLNYFLALKGNKKCV
jgi:hypothetical protein